MALTERSRPNAHAEHSNDEYGGAHDGQLCGFRDPLGNDFGLVVSI